MASLSVIKPRWHCLAAAVHPKTLDGKQHTCGYVAKTYRGTEPEDPEDKAQAVQRARAALDKCRAVPALAGRGQVLDLGLADRRAFDDEITRLKTTKAWYDETWTELPGYDHKRDPLRPALAGEGGPLPPISKVQEFLVKSMPMDPDGFFWGRGGHWPLFAQIGMGRDRSSLAYSQRDTREEKKAYCRRWGVWPWWMVHTSEQGLWCAPNSYIVGNQPRGQGHKGVLWRLTRAKYTVEEFMEYERPWVEEYGEEAMRIALAHSEPYYQQALAAGLTVETIWAEEAHWHFFEPATR
ncbi:MAG: hypothetical protein GY772_17735 [bacterium]|nr:hypothetical protein [bacterium]